MHRTRTTAAALMAVAAVMPVALTVANAGESYGGYSSLAQKEMIRRQNAVSESDRLRDEGRDAYAKGDYKEAVDKYKESLQVLPDAPMVQDRRTYLTQLLADGSAALGENYRKVGKYDEARQLADDVLAVDANNVEAKRLNDWLDDPIRTNPALTYEHTEAVDEVRRKLYTAQGAFDLGKFDEAHRVYEQVLRIDPYNKAARRGMEKVAQARTDYYRAAYDQTRAQLLSEVDKAWELSVPPLITEDFNTGPTDPTAGTGTTYILNKLKTIVIPVINFEDTSVEEAIDFLRLRSIELDTTELNPAKKGINFVIRKPRGGASGDAGLDADANAGLGATQDPGTLRIDQLSLRNVPLAEALKYICDKTKLRYKVDDFAVTLVPATETDEDLFTRSFRVPPDFMSKLGGGGGAGDDSASDDPFASDAGGGTTRTLAPRKSLKELLETNGVSFPDGSSANFFAGSSTLSVRNTPTNIDLIEQIVADTTGDTPKQVKISTKFVEISQENTDELGFDWMVSPFGLSANQVFLGGGTIGSGMARTNADFISPVGDASNLVNLPGVPSSTGTNVTDIVTGGLRSGDGAINRNSIDAVLNNPNRNAQNASPAPGIAALTGLFSNSEVQLIMRGLAQKKGTDLMTAPSITARSGEKALIEIIREFIYPTEYEPPELPNSIGGGVSTGGLGLSSGGSSFPVTPATPTSFETRNTGVTLEIEPTIGGNDFVIDLRFAPDIVEFEGFVNYGSPIQSPATDFLGNPVTVIITENRIEMPVFSSRRVTTALTIYDGYTVAVGGLMREDVQTVEDKVPILGDIPIVGRLFQSRSENRIKSNLIIFVTAQIIDATGRPIRGGDALPTANEGSGDGVLPPPPMQ